MLLVRIAVHHHLVLAVAPGLGKGLRRPNAPSVKVLHLGQGIIHGLTVNIFGPYVFYRYLNRFNGSACSPDSRYVNIMIGFSIVFIIDL